MKTEIEYAENWLNEIITHISPNCAKHLANLLKEWTDKQMLPLNPNTDRELLKKILEELQEIKSRLSINTIPTDPVHIPYPQLQYTHAAMCMHGNTGYCSLCYRITW